MVKDEKKEFPLEELVERVFCARNASHLEHWRTDSFSKHMALGDFYDKLIDQIDTIVEVYQGAYGKQKLELDYEDYCPGDAVDWIKEHVKWIYENKKDICRNNPMLINIVEELLALYCHTEYKLVNLG